MRSVLVIAIFPFLLGCGAEMMGAAATAASARAKENEEAKKTLQRARDQIGAIGARDPRPRG